MSGQLSEKGTDKIAQPLFVDIPKVEIEIRHRRISGLAYVLDILDDHRTDKRRQSLLKKTTKSPRTRVRFFRIQLHYRMRSDGIGRKRKRTNVFRGHREANHLTSIPDIFCLRKTILLLSCDESHVRCYGSLMGLVGIAICECFPAIVSLKGMCKAVQ